MLYYFSQLKGVGIAFLMGLSATLQAQTESDPPPDFAQIAPIIGSHCTPCHQKKKIGPMPLRTYEEVRSYGQMIKYVTSERIMPPWLPLSEKTDYLHQRTLSKEQIDSIARWVEAGMPNRSNIEQFSHVDDEGREQKSGDIQICMDTTFQQFGVYMDQFQVFLLPTGLEKDVWVKDVQFLPGNSQIARAARVSVIQNVDKWQALDDWDPRYGYYSYGSPGALPAYQNWMQWSVENPPNQSMYRFLPANSYLLLEMHYGPIGSPSLDRSCLIMDTLGTSPPSSRRLRTLSLINRNGSSLPVEYLPAGEKTRVHARISLPSDLTVHSISPRANLICRSWEVFAVLPDREVIPLLEIDDWLVNWAENYQLKTPVSLPEGAVIHALATYDNRTQNPYNPASPPIDIPWGHGMYFEQFQLDFDCILPSTDSSFHLFPLPQFAEGDPLRVSFSSNRRDQYTLQLHSIHTGELKMDTSFFANSGKGRFSFDSSLPADDYFLAILDDQKRVVAFDYVMVREEKGFMQRKE